MKKSHRQKHRDQIKKFAAEAFENHIITRESEIMWLCKRPGTIVYHFRVLTPPGAVLIYGDIGDLFLRQYHRSLPWIRGSATNPDSPDYVLGKVPLRFVEKEFLPEEAREYLEVEFPTGDYYPEDQVKEIKEEYKWYIDQDSDGYHWDRILYEITGDCEYPRCRDWSSQMLWGFHALCWFANNVDPNQTVE